MDRRVHVGWKPILVYTKGKMPEDARWVYDVVTSDSADKEYHHWGQGLSGFLQLVERFTNPGQLVLDPFNGGGTTGIAALQLNRMYIGIDNDQTAIATTLNRIAETFAGKDTGEDVPSA